MLWLPLWPPRVVWCVVLACGAPSLSVPRSPAVLGFRSLTCVPRVLGVGLRCGWLQVLRLLSLLLPCAWCGFSLTLLPVWRIVTPRLSLRGLSGAPVASGGGSTLRGGRLLVSYPPLSTGVLGRNKQKVHDTAPFWHQRGGIFPPWSARSLMSSQRKGIHRSDELMKHRV